MNLTQKIADKRKALAAEREQAANPRTDPRDRYHCEERAERLRGEILALQSALEEGQAIAKGAEELVFQLASSRHQSRERSLAITKFEEATLWLRKEIEG